MRVAVVGAGMAGAAAAHDLARAGLGVTVFDKGRQAGGRMATRRGTHTFDHGAQIMRARGPAFAARLADWRDRGVVAPWADAAIGCPAMTAPVADLLAGLDVRFHAAVTDLSEGPGGWRVACSGAPDAAAYDAVVLAVPAPQAVRLLRDPGPALAALSDAAYAPCWSLMLALPDDPPIPDVWRPDAGPIATVFREGAKPGRAESPPRFVVHATPDWSRTHLEDTPEAVAADLLAALGTGLHRRLAPLHAQAHRWRYALVETALDTPCLYDPAQRIGACGDYCLGPRVEAAFDSGRALAACLLAGRSGRG